MFRDDPTRLRHMLDAAVAAREFVEGRTRGDLDTDRMLSFAVVRAVEIIGEAASNVSRDGRQLYGAIEWPKIVAMRHRIVHAYYDVDLDIVWQVVTEDLPPLIAELEQIVPRLPPWE